MWIHRREGGQTAVDYAGVLAVVALVVVALSTTGAGADLAEAFRAAICRITGGACATGAGVAVPEWEPDTVCAVGSSRQSIDVSGRGVVFDLGAGRSVVVDEMADGTWEVTWADSGEGGASLKAEAGAGVTIGQTEVGLEAEASVGALLVAEAGDKRRFDDAESAAGYVRDRLIDEGIELLPQGARQLTALGRVAVDHLTGTARDDGDLVEAYGQAGVTARGTIGATAGPLTAGIDAELGPDMRFVVGADGSRTVMAVVDGEAASALGLQVVAEQSRTDAAELLLAYSFDAQGTPSTLSITRMRSGSDEFALLGSGDDLATVLADVDELAGAFGSAHGEQVVVVNELDLTAPAARASFDAFVDGLPSTDDPTGDPGATVAAGRELAGMLRDDSVVSVARYRTEDFTAGAEAKVSLGPGVALDGAYVTRTTTLADAFYLDRTAGTLVPWEACSR